MNLEILRCPVCFVDYNSQTNVPTIIPTCGHTICSICIRQINNQGYNQSCPLDRIPFGARRVLSSSDSSSSGDYNNRTYNRVPSGTFKTNIALLQMLDEHHRVNQISRCPTHSELPSIVCFTDQVKICSECAFSDQHRDHQMQHIKKVNVLSESRKEELSSKVRDFKAHYKNYNSHIGETKKNIQQLREEGTKRLSNLLNDKSEEIWADTCLFLTEKKVKYDESVNKELSIVKNIESQIDELTKVEMNPRFFEAFANDKSEEILVENNLPSFVEETEQIKERITKAFEDIATYLGKVFQRYNPIFPSSNIDSIEHSIQQTRLDSNKSATISDILNAKIDQKLLVLSLVDERGKIENSTEINWKQIEDVVLDLTATTFQESPIYATCFILNRLKDIVKCQLSLSDQVIASQYFSVLSSNKLWNSPSLKCFELKISHCASADEKIAELLDKFIPMLTNLTQFTLDCSQTNNLTQTFEVLKDKILPLMSHLKWLELCCANSDISSEAIFGLLKAIGVIRMASPGLLETLVLNFNSTSFDHLAVKALSESVFNHQTCQLETFKLYLKNTPLKDLGDASTPSKPWN